MTRNHAIFSGARFTTMVNVTTSQAGAESYEVQKWGNVDAVPHAVPFPIQKWQFPTLTEAYTFAKSVEVD